MKKTNAPLSTLLLFFSVASAIVVAFVFYSYLMGKPARSMSNIALIAAFVGTTLGLVIAGSVNSFKLVRLMQFGWFGAAIIGAFATLWVVWSLMWKLPVPNGHRWAVLILLAIPALFMNRTFGNAAVFEEIEARANDPDTVYEAEVVNP